MWISDISTIPLFHIMSPAQYRQGAEWVCRRRYIYWFVYGDEDIQVRSSHV